MKPKQIAVCLYWKGVYGRDQRINAIASFVSMMDEGGIKTIAVSFENLPATVKGAFETAKRSEKDSMMIEIFVEDGYSRQTIHGEVKNISSCHLVKEEDKLVVDFTFEELRRNETYSMTEMSVVEVINEAYGSDVESMEEEI